MEPIFGYSIAEMREKGKNHFTLHTIVSFLKGNSFGMRCAGFADNHTAAAQRRGIAVCGDRFVLCCNRPIAVRTIAHAVGFLSGDAPDFFLGHYAFPEIDGRF